MNRLSLRMRREGAQEFWPCDLTPEIAQNAMETKTLLTDSLDQKSSICFCDSRIVNKRFSQKFWGGRSGNKHEQLGLLLLAGRVIFGSESFNQISTSAPRSARS